MSEHTREAASRFRGIRNAPPEALRKVMEPYMADPVWDRPHRLLVVCWDSERAWVDQESTAPLSMAPTKIPRFILSRTRMAYERHVEAVEAGRPPMVYAVALVNESFGVSDLGPDASEWERARLARDRRERRYHEREDAVEMRGGYMCDIDGRMHTLTLYRDRPDVGMEYSTIDADGEGEGPFRAITGPLPIALWGAAKAYAMLLHGDVMPPVPPPGSEQVQHPATGGEVLDLTARLVTG